MLSFYYKDDSEVKRDSELQQWIRDIYEYGFLSQNDTGELKVTVSKKDLWFLANLFLVNACLLSHFGRNSTEPRLRRGDGEVCHHGRLHVLSTALSCQRRTGKH